MYSSKNLGDLFKINIVGVPEESGRLQKLFQVFWNLLTIFHSYERVQVHVHQFRMEDIASC